MSARRLSPRARRAVHAAVVAAALTPALSLPVRFLWGDGLGAEPIETVTHTTGEWAIRLLLATLAVTPVRRILGWPALAPYRRSFGLLAFAYATLHLATWVGLEQFFDWDAMVEDVVERPWVTAGLAAWLAMAPLAATSTRGMARRLGRRWVRLHRLVYVAAVAAVVHHAWLVKADLRGPLVHATILAALLAWRLARPRGQS